MPRKSGQTKCSHFGDYLFNEEEEFAFASIMEIQSRDPSDIQPFHRTVLSCLPVRLLSEKLSYKTQPGKPIS